MGLKEGFQQHSVAETGGGLSGPARLTLVAQLFGFLVMVVSLHHMLAPRKHDHKSTTENGRTEKFIVLSRFF